MFPVLLAVQISGLCWHQVSSCYVSCFCPHYRLLVGESFSLSPVGGGGGFEGERGWEKWCDPQKSWNYIVEGLLNMVLCL